MHANGVKQGVKGIPWHVALDTPYSRGNTNRFFGVCNQYIVIGIASTSLTFEVIHVAYQIIL
jgi:hypothetical protein